MYVSEEDITVDEYLPLWKGRLKFFIYIPSKRERYGVKIYMLCESSTGYLVSFIIYCGSETKYTVPADIDLLKDFDEYANLSKVTL